MNSGGASTLRLEGLVRRFTSGAGEIEVLRGVDLDLGPGVFAGLVGPSGSGKSSLLHAAGLLEKPTAGEVWIDGRPCLSLSDDERTRVRRANIGFVYQFHHLLPEFSALDNVVLPQLIGGRARKDAAARAAELLEIVGLSHRIDHQPAQLSGGEQQRVAIARALANSPRILLADEPTGNLDPTTSESVFQTLFELSRTRGVTALIATHNLGLTRFMDRVFALEDGRLTERPRSGQAAR